MQQNVVLQRVHADHEVWSQHGTVVQLLLEACDICIVLVDNLGLAAAQDLLAVGDAAWDPALEQVVSLCQLCRARHGTVLPVASADEQDDAASPRHFLDHLGSSTKVRSSDLERDDVHALSNAVDVARVGRIPQRCDMSLVGLRGQEELEGDICRRGRVVEESVRLVVGTNICAQLAHLLHLLLVRTVLLCNVVGQ